MLPVEIRKEAARYADGDTIKLEAFIAGAMFAKEGKYYIESKLFQETSLDVPSFDDWWNLYNKKRGRKKAEAKWKRLSDKDKIDCMNATPIYLSTIDDKQFQKDPLTYLNGECWNDEIIPHKSYEQRRAIELSSKASRILNTDNQG